MTPKKFFLMLATGVCLSLFTAAPASACAGGDTLHEAAHAHVGGDDGARLEVLGATAPTSKGVREAGRAASDEARRPGATKFGRAAAARFQDDDEFDIFGSCIHGGGDCGCTGPKSHTRRCGTYQDCETHPGLKCTWG